MCTCFIMRILLNASAQPGPVINASEIAANFTRELIKSFFQVLKFTSPMSLCALVYDNVLLLLSTEALMRRTEFAMSKLELLTSGGRTGRHVYH